jgi:segregation and condensation protein B
MSEDFKKYQASLEAILFAAGEPVEINKIAEFLEIKIEICEGILKNLADYYIKSGRGLSLIFKQGKVQMVSSKEYGDVVSKFLKKELTTELSAAAAEVLAVVAYRGPVSRYHIEQIRGVNCSFTLRNLAMRGLIERVDNPMDSRSYLYQISFDFLKNLGLSKIEELPEYEELRNAKALNDLHKQEDQG